MALKEVRIILKRLTEGEIKRAGADPTIVTSRRKTKRKKHSPGEKNRMAQAKYSARHYVRKAIKVD